MEFVSDKVTSFTGTALSEVRSKWIHQQQQQPDQTQETIASDSNAIQTQQVPLGLTGRGSMAKTNANNHDNNGSPLAGGFPFGGDSHSRRRSAFPPAPPIGFRTDLLLAQTDASRHQPGSVPKPGSAPADSQAPPPSSVQLQARPEVPLDVSSESLYQGDAWSRLWFQRVMILCLLRLLLFIRKVYEDFQATKVYNLTGQQGHFIIAATTLFMPTIVFTIYRVARYLQLTLPPLRANKQELPSSPQKRETGPTKRAEDAATAATVTHSKSISSTRATSNDEDAQLRRALMSSPDQSGGMSTPVGGGASAEDDGLVTARQTPTNMEEFHDSKSQQGSIVEAAPDSGLEGRGAATQSVQPAPPRPPPRRSNDGETAATAKLESINVDKMGDLPDRETVRVFVGASEQLLHGVLFIFWQLKRQVDVMGYLVDRACLWRKPAEREKEELNRMNCHRDGLEWFQDFYAAFLAILAQVYTLGLHWSSSKGGGEPSSEMKHLSATQLNAATSGLGSGTSEGPSSGADSSASRVVSSILSTQAFALAGKDVLLMSELIVSSAVVFSLLICVRRRDDGPLTLGLSMLGWGSLFAARIIIIALAFVHIGWLIMLPLVVLHIVAISGWIYSIALDSHNNLASEMDDEAIWDEEAAIEQQQQRERQDAIELNEAAPSEVTTTMDQSARQLSPTPMANNEQQQLEQQTVTTQRTRSITSNWSVLEHLVLLAQILTLFAIPSLFYWPIMFNLKLHLRPFKYLVLVLTQNFLLIPAIWFTISAQASATPGQLYLLGAVGAFSIVGFIFVSLYVACKPSLTEYFARADELFNEAEKSGIYYEFCSRVFRMPDLSKGAFRRLMNQTEEIIEEQQQEE
uniref:XK-related protein n=1 Tax=Aceria tosichella TaxID=561515 RepID=A0A6G1SK38_9ACAR